MDAAARRRMLEQMLNDAPDDPELHYALGMEDIGAGDHAAAIERFRALIARQPERPHVPAFLMAAQSLQKLGRIPEAMAVLRDGVAAAHKQNNHHAAGEMQGMLDMLE